MRTNPLGISVSAHGNSHRFEVYAYFPTLPKMEQGRHQQKLFPIFALITFSWENTRKKHWNKKHKFPLHFSCTKKLVSKTIKFCGFSIIFINDVQH